MTLFLSRLFLFCLERKKTLSNLIGCHRPQKKDSVKEREAAVQQKHFSSFIRAPSLRALAPALAAALAQSSWYTLLYRDGKEDAFAAKVLKIL